MSSVASLSRGQRAVIATAALAIRYFESLAQGQAGWNARALLDANGYRTAFQSTYNDNLAAMLAAYPSAAGAVPQRLAVGSGFTTDTRLAMRAVLMLTVGNAIQVPLASMPTTETGLGVWSLREGISDFANPSSAFGDAVLQLGVYTGANVAVEASTWAFGFINQLSLPGPVQDSRVEQPWQAPPQPTAPATTTAPTTAPTVSTPTAAPVGTQQPVTTPSMPSTTSNTNVTTTTPPASTHRDYGTQPGFAITGRTFWQRFPLWAVLLLVGFGTAGGSLLWVKYRGKGKATRRRRRR